MATGDGNLQPRVKPTTALLSASQVLGWIAFREPRNRRFSDELISLTGETSLWPVNDALAGRTAAHPYCAVRFAQPDDFVWGDSVYAHRILSPTGPAQLRWIRAQARRREKCFITYSDLAVLVRNHMELCAREEVQIKQATHDLLEALRGRKLVAYGRCYRHGNTPDRNTGWQAVDPVLLIDPRLTVTESDQIETDIDHPTALFDYKGPWFADVRFQTAEVLTIWPFEAPVTNDLPLPHRDLDSAQVSDRTGERGRPTSKHLVLGELRRRQEIGETEVSLAAQGRALSTWLADTHKGMAPMAAKSVENAIRATFRQIASQTPRNKTSSPF